MQVGKSGCVYKTYNNVISYKLLGPKGITVTQNKIFTVANSETSNNIYLIVFDKINNEVFASKSLFNNLSYKINLLQISNNVTLISSDENKLTLTEYKPDVYKILK